MYHHIKTNAIKVTKNKSERASATFVITPNSSFWNYRGEKIKDEHFNLMLPVKVKIFKTY